MQGEDARALRFRPRPSDVEQPDEPASPAAGNIVISASGRRRAAGQQVIGKSAAVTIVRTPAVRTAWFQRYSRPVLTEFRGWIARLLALCVFVLTLGRVQVNASGKSTAGEPGRDETHTSARRTP